MAAKNSEGERLIKLALFIKEHGPVSLADIRRGVHEYAFAPSSMPAADAARLDARVHRMFSRDKESLAACGLRVLCDAGGRYSLDPAASFSAPLELAPAEASLLRMLCAALLEDESYPLKNELRLVVAKLASELEAPDLLPLGTEATQATKTTKLPGFAKLRRAIERRKRLSFDYVNSRGQARPREAEPAGCFFLQGLCYLVAFDPSAQAMRTFRLDRMSHISVNAASPTVPDFAERSFNAADYYWLPFQFGEGEPVAARVRFDAANAWRAEGACMGKGELRECGDGAVEWQVQARDLRRLAAWCVENGPGVVPLAPAAAVAEYRAGLERVAGTSAHPLTREPRDAASGGAR